MEASNQPVKYDGDDEGPSKVLTMVVAVIVIAVIGGIVAWILIDRSGSDSSVPTTTTASVDTLGPKIVSASGLSKEAGSLGQPVYWAGDVPGMRIEFSRITNGNAYVRYLPAGVNAGDPRAKFLIVATYPFPGAYDALKKVSNGKAVDVKGGGLALVSEGNAKSVHVAYPGVDYQMEVFHPSAARAIGVATSGDVQPVP